MACALSSAARATWPDSYEEVSVVSSAAPEVMRKIPRAMRATVVREERCGWRKALDLRTISGVREDDDEEEAARGLLVVVA